MQAAHLSPQAEVDLIELWAYVADDSSHAADRRLERIEETISQLAQFPESGRHRPELGQGVRSFPVGRHIVLYRQTASGLEVARVVDGARYLPDLI